jgi:hypothetical protein
VAAWQLVEAVGVPAVYSNGQGMPGYQQ